MEMLNTKCALAKVRAFCRCVALKIRLIFGKIHVRRRCEIAMLRPEMVSFFGSDSKCTEKHISESEYSGIIGY